MVNMVRRTRSSEWDIQSRHFSFIHFLCYDERDHKPPEFRDPLSQLRNLSLELDSIETGERFMFQKFVNEEFIDVSLLICNILFLLVR